MTRNTLLLLTVIAALVGCGGEPPATPDGGTTPDAGTSDGGTADTGVAPDAPAAAPVCDDVRTIELALGPNEITGNTTGRGNDVELGPNCGNPEAARAPQEAVALAIPGTGLVGVRFSLATDGTAADFDTIVELRRDGCAVLAGAEGCEGWDDIDYPAETRSGGAFLATGGETVHLIVSGWDTANAGAWQMDVEAEAVNAPTETSAAVTRIDSIRFDIDVMGGDVDGDAAGVRAEFLDATGAVLETADVAFVDSVEGMTTFSARARILNEDVVAAAASATQARVSILDQYLAASEPMTVTIVDAMESGRGEVCDATHVCADSFECTAGACQIPAAVATFCASAAPITLVPVGTDTTSTTVTGTVAAMAGSIVGVCIESDTSGAEVLYGLSVPAAVAPVTGYDVVLDTENAATGEGDTVVYFQSTCGDPETTVQCNDDIDREGMNYASHVDATNVAAGTYTIAVEGYGVLAAPLPFELEIGLRPVLATGTACDPAGVMNRCAAGACPAATPVCP